MKNLNVENETVQSILHMVVNSGEQDHYPTTCKKYMEILADDFFSGNSSAARKYIEACLTMEVYEHQEEYAQGPHNTDSAVDQADQTIYELHSTLMGYLNTK